MYKIIDMPENDWWGLKAKAYRLEKGLTTRQVADRSATEDATGISHSWLVRAENHPQNLGSHVIEAWARGLGVPRWWFDSWKNGIDPTDAASIDENLKIVSLRFGGLAAENQKRAAHLLDTVRREIERMEQEQKERE